MTHVPNTFRPLHDGWTVTAVDPGSVPAGLLDDAPVPAMVPGEIHVDLYRARIIDDPFDGDNEAAQQWIGDTSWRYETTFQWEPGSTDRHDLVALGLDTLATVELNGRVLGETENMHRSYRFDARGALRPGENTLSVTFAPPVPASQARAEQFGALPRVNHHEYNQLRKMACSFGWDWGIDVAGAGIWRPIGLDSWSGVRVAAVRPLVGVDDGDGVLSVHVDIERDGTTTAAVPVEVVVSAPDGQPAVRATGTVPAGRTSVVIETRVPQARLWWPVGHGDQPLYGVEVRAGEAAWSGRVGFRTVDVDTSPDEGGAGFTLRVNGEPVLVRGVNWIPDHAFLTEIDRQRYRARLDDALEANCNLVRVWGGGIYESDDFYDLADERGLLVWQDFAFACAAYSEEAAMRAEIEAEARENITRLTPHPSLVVWNGNNENTWGSVDWGWQQQLAGRGWGDWYYRTLLPTLLAELDPTRFYSPASPYSFGDYRHPNDERYGTMHIWDVWNRVDYTVYRDYRSRFVSEFGFQAPPAWSTLARVVHDEPLTPFGPQMLVHQKANLGNQKLERGWQGHLPDPATIEDWHWTTQLNQAQAVRFGVEHFRSLTPHNTGTILWQLNDNWPVVSWAAVDFDGHRKPLWHALRASYAPRLATFQPRPSEAAIAAAWEGAEPEADRTALVLVNDTAEPFAGSFTLTRRTFAGEVLAETSMPVSIPARGTASVLLPEEIANFTDPAAEVVVATTGDAAGFAPAFWNAAEVVAQSLDPKPVTAQAVRRAGGYAVTITATSYVRDLFCHVDRVDPEARVDRGMVTLLPGESVTFDVTSAVDVDPSEFADTVRSANDLLMYAGEKR
ncbi:MAG TPA: glycoside hydrolase family 2 protein [Flexivirga sp.]|uniref:glycoside hydrolase family 2 protein n=1 Tax=Flexivirga sp. TaxID=1962927 RepID=UPI002BBC9DCA|nr:glycoside hydrolase family 2 protein [Flexivirga sp.]HWC23575.1 glycoside hydrolase family 2 protein [Flexivirga sp.]